MKNWHATVTADLGRLFWAAHATLGTEPDRTHGLYSPNNPRDKAAQAMEAAARRGKDRDVDYQTIPTAHVKSSERSDPTANAAERHLWDDVGTVTALATLVDDFYRAVAMELHMFGRDVVGRHGGIHEPPDVMWTRQGGRKIADVPPSQAGRYVTDACTWMWWAAHALADAPGDPETHRDRMGNLQARTRQTLKRVRRRAENVPAHRRPCANPHGLTRHPAGDNAEDGVCRKCATASRCATCDRNLAAQDSKGRSKSDCWSCIGKKKRARQKENAT